MLLLVFASCRLLFAVYCCSLSLVVCLVLLFAVDCCCWLVVLFDVWRCYLRLQVFALCCCCLLLLHLLFAVD